MRRLHDLHEDHDQSPWLDNLRRGFGGGFSPAEVRRLGRRGFQHVCMNLLEACR